MSEAVECNTLLISIIHLHELDNVDLSKSMLLGRVIPFWSFIYEFSCRYSVKVSQLITYARVYVCVGGNINKTPLHNLYVS